MKSSIDLSSSQERDGMAYHEVVTAAQRLLVSDGFVFTRSIDVTTDNPTLLFNISGGVRYEHVLSGDEPAPSPASVASIQRCIRADGLDKVGYTGRHHVAFDMLGHFSFFEHDEEGAKRAGIIPAYHLLQELGVQDVFARHHPEDFVSKKVLAELGVVALDSLDNIHICNNKKRSGNRVEFGRLVDGVPTELWNIVFTLYEGIDDSRTPLAKVAFDSGASIDRLVAAANGMISDYEASHWKSILDQIDSRVPYNLACRAVDFARAASVLTQSGVAPGPKKQEYIARKVFSELIRLEIADIGLDMKNILQGVTLAHETGADIEVLLARYEAEKVRVERSIKIGKKAVEARKKSTGGELNEEDYAYLKSTHGLDAETVNHLLTVNE